MRFWPCKPCCDYECFISDGDEDGTECGGVWTRDESPHSTPNHATEDSDAIWYGYASQRTGLPWRVQATANLEVTPTGGFNYGSYVLLLIGAFVDCSNYVFLRYTEHRPDAGSLSWIKLELVVVVGGNEEILAEHVYDSQDCYDKTADGDLDTAWGFENGELNLTVDLQMCFDGETLMGQVPYYFGPSGIAGPDLLMVASHKLADNTPLSVALSGGRFAGYGTGTLSTEVTLACFTEFDFRHYETTDSSDTECGECFPHCCGSPVPGELIIEIASVPSGRSTGTPYGCSIDCDDFNGTFYLYQQIGEFGTSALPCAGDGNCGWVYSIQVSDSECDEGSFPDQPYPAYLNISALITSWGNEVDGTPYRKITITLTITNGPDSPVEIETVEYSIATACDEWTDWIDLEFSTPADDFCAIEGVATIRFKMVP